MRFGLLKSPIIAGCLLSLSNLTYSENTVDIGFVSEYVRNGIGQSEGKPVLQGGVTIPFHTGFYMGAWATGLDRGSEDSMRLELDGYAGLYYPFNSFLAADVGYTYASFLGDDSIDDQAYGEFFASMLLNDATTIGYRYTDDYMGLGEGLQTIELAHTINAGSFGFEFSLRQYQYLDTTDDVNWGDSESRDDYFHFRVGAVRNYGSNNFGLTLEKTNLPKEFDGNIQIVFSYSRSFGF